MFSLLNSHVKIFIARCLPYVYNNVLQMRHKAAKCIIYVTFRTFVIHI